VKPFAAHRGIGEMNLVSAIPELPAVLQFRDDVRISRSGHDGYNQMDLITGKGPSARHEIFYFTEGTLSAVRIGDFKYRFTDQPGGWFGGTVQGREQHRIRVGLVPDLRSVRVEVRFNSDPMSDVSAKAQTSGAAQPHPPQLQIAWILRDGEHFSERAPHLPTCDSMDFWICSLLTLRHHERLTQSTDGRRRDER
jgi:hypothetical protein